MAHHSLGAIAGVKAGVFGPPAPVAARSTMPACRSW